MNRSMYRKVARQHGVSVAEVKREMQIVIEATYENPTKAAMAVPREGEVPTTEEFIDYCAREIKPRPLNLEILQ